MSLVYVYLGIRLNYLPFAYPRISAYQSIYLLIFTKILLILLCDIIITLAQRVIFISKTKGEFPLIFLLYLGFQRAQLYLRYLKMFKICFQRKQYCGQSIKLYKFIFQ